MSRSTAPCEREIQAAVLAHWRSLAVPGTLVAAVPNAGALGQPGLHRGLFDLVVIGGPFLRGRTGWLELKTAKGRVSDHQKTFKDICIHAGVPYAITFGRDEPIRVLEEWGVVRPAARDAA
jgi:hypothetical protein